jgi:hypothetical protein
VLPNVPVISTILITIIASIVRNYLLKNSHFIEKPKSRQKKYFRCVVYKGWSALISGTMCMKKPS